MDIHVVGVVGAGVMGSGVAQNLAQTDHQVILLDVSTEILERAKREIKENMRLQGLFTETQGVHSADDVVKQITFSTDYQLLANVDFVIENVTEKWEIKKEVYAQLDAMCPKECILAANTSTIPVTRLATSTKRATQVIGMHFMNPVPLKSMVEVIRGVHTSDETVDRAKRLLTQMGKDCVIVRDSPGFVTNRVLMLSINEAIHLVEEKVASAKDIDKLFRTCFGHKMGPLETADLIGLDTVLNSIQVLYESLNDSKYQPCPLLKQMVDAGLYGRKSGQGFYSYQIMDP